MQKKRFYNEIAYLVGLFSLGWGTALMEKANFGMSAVAAPVYLVYRRLSQISPFFTFGVTEYILQVFALITTIIILRKFKWGYFFSLITAMLYSTALDTSVWLSTPFASTQLIPRIFLLLFGIVFCALGVSFLFQTYLAPGVYDLFVKEFALKYGFDASKVKTCYDCSSFVVAVILSFSFFGLWQFEGIHVGTLLCALVNGWLIGQFRGLWERLFVFSDRLPLRQYFQ